MRQATSVSPTLPGPPPLPRWRSLFSMRSRRAAAVAADLAAALPEALPLPPPTPFEEHAPIKNKQPVCLAMQTSAASDPDPPIHICSERHVAALQLVCCAGPR